MKKYDPMLPKESVRFQNILNKFSELFEKYGFSPHLTSVFCNLKAMQDAIEKEEDKDDIFCIADPEEQLKDDGLRYDHTVPLEQYIKNNRGKIAFPFKRYAAQPVYRKKDTCGIYEVYSCDIDIIGRTKLSPAYDAEILCAVCETLNLFHDVKKFHKKYRFFIKINNVKLLNGLLTCLNVPEKEIHKLQHDIGKKEKLKNKLTQFNSDHGLLDKVLDRFYQINEKGLDSQEKVVKALKQFQTDCLIDNIGSQQFSEGIKEIEFVCESSKQLEIDESAVRICPTSVRSMTYYTGTIISTFLEKDGQEVSDESFCHGGRYSFQGEKETFVGVGVTFNMTLLFNRLQAEKLFGDEFLTTAPVIVSGAAYKDNASKKICSVRHAMYLARILREKGIKTEVFLEESMSIKEQIEHAKKRGFHIFLWTEEHLERELQSDDLVMRRNLKVPESENGPPVLCSALFTGIELTLRCNADIF